MAEKKIQSKKNYSQKKAANLSLLSVFGDNWEKESKNLFIQYIPFKKYVQSAKKAAFAKADIGAEFIVIDRNNDLRLMPYLCAKVLTKTLNGKPLKYDENTYSYLSDNGMELGNIDIQSVKVNGKEVKFHLIEDLAVFQAGINDSITINDDNTLDKNVSIFESKRILYKGKTYEVRKGKTSIPGYSGGLAEDSLYPFLKYKLIPDENEQSEDEVTIELIDDPSFNVSVFDVFFEEGVNQFYFGDTLDKEKIFRRVTSNKETGRIVLKLDGRSIDPSQRIHVCANVIQLNRELNAIDGIVYRPNENQRPLLNLAASKLYKDPLQTFIPKHLKLDYKVLSDSSREGTAEQRDFVQKALQTPDFMILQGPPGSGKTTAILELIYQLCKEGKKVLLCASTHVAIDNVLEKIINHKDSDELLKVINPVRVASESDLCSDAVKPFLYKNQVFGVEEYKGIVEQSFNLVCGTVIGVLSFPPISAAVEDAKNVSIEPLFDVMILDEASKTTFSEFLVPAVISKRWVIVGDVKQLAPYVEKNDLIPSLLECPPLKDSNDRLGLNMLLTLTSDNSRKYINHAFVIPRSAIEYVDEHFKADLSLPVVAVTNGKINRFTHIDAGDLKEKSPVCVALSSNTAAFLIDEELLKETLELLPNKARVFHYATNIKAPALFDRYQILHTKGCFDQKYTDEYNDWSRKVEDEILWRLIRLYELNEDQGTAKKYQSRIQQYRELISDEKNVQIGQKPDGTIRYSSQRDFFDQTIETLRNIAIPSIIMMLQEGINKGAKFDTILSSGFTDEEKTNRFVRLEYQHRMHPDISSIPRRFVYKGEALKDSVSWVSQMDYPSESKKRFEARHVDPSVDTSHNRNENEADAIINELKMFMEYAKTTPKKDGKRYQVAILSFYNGQIIMLRKKLQDLFQVSNKYNYHGENLDVSLNTVDRFQGQEADVVYLSTVRSGMNKTIGFLDSVNRVNVALTRAKEKIVVFGDKSFFTHLDKSEILRQLFEEDK